MKRKPLRLQWLLPLAMLALLGGALEAQPGGPALDAALDHLDRNAAQLGLTAEDLADKIVTDQYESSRIGVTHIYFKQRLQGIEVANGTINVNVDRQGAILNVGNRFVGRLAAKVNRRSPAIDALEAIGFAATDLGLSQSIEPGLIERLGGPEQAALFTGADLSLDDIPAKLAYYKISQDEVRLTWEILLRQVDQQHWWSLWIDAETGAILARVDLIHADNYQVFAVPKESPSDGPRTIEANPADPTASPFGWHDTNGASGAEFTDTRGNNVFAQEDRDANNSGGFRPDGGASLDFQYPLDLATEQPVDYQDAAITNLFYWNNVLHDILYRYGFDEASGNFQENNYGRGGAGSDAVLADAQDGLGTNNANFSVPPDGSNPRMQMFEWLSPFDHSVEIAAGSSAAGTYGASGAEFGPSLDSIGLTGAVVAAVDGGSSSTDACETLTNVNAVDNNIALVDRGSCDFVVKVRNAQDAGAIGVIVANNAGDSVLTMGDNGTGGDIVIPSVMVGQTDGATIRNGLPATATLRGGASSSPNRDSDLDAGVIAHEYCHGLSNRLTGGPNSVFCLSGNQQAGEGWSDLCSLFFTAKASDTATTPRGVGAYVTFDPPGGGIRQYPYTTDIGANPLTYGELTTGSLSVPHGIGTVWAAAVWEVYWNLVNEYGFDPDLYSGTGGNNLAVQLVVDGLKMQPCNPTFLDARDAILAADQVDNGGANECRIWEGFAKRGMGVDASDGGGSNSLNVTESFLVPASCVSSGCGNGVCEAGEDCNSCASDCVSGTTAATCGNGVCEAGNGEDCLTCAQDCNGKQNGRPSNRYCCGAGGGQNPLDCSDSLCTGGGNTCTNVPVSSDPFCCGDAVCDTGESCSSCGLDCAVGAEICTNGFDDDCNGAIDCDDSACDSDPACQTSGCVATHNKEKGPRCTDGIDNDCDGLIDSADPDC